MIEVREYLDAEGNSPYAKWFDRLNGALRTFTGATISDGNGKRCMVALTKDFKETIQARAQQDPAFRKALLQEGVECLLAGDVDTGKAVLRDYINATIGFEELSQVFDKSSKSLMRMFGPKGNPQASNLFAVIQYLQEQEGIHLEVKARKVA